MFQSAPPHGGRRSDQRDGQWHVSLEVSIRAPARGATSRIGWTHARTPSRFQSAPPHGGRPWRSPGRAPARVNPCFNPRPRTGGDGGLRRDQHQDGKHVFQSAPPHGGRHELQGAGDSSGARTSCFNPRPRTGGDDRASGTRSQFLMTFQSAPPHGGRHDRLGGPRIALVGFNPRPRTGGDPTCHRVVA